MTPDDPAFAPPTADPHPSTTPAAPTGHYGPGYGDPTPVDTAAGAPEASTDPDQAYARWRDERLREFDEDYAAWRQGGEGQFPTDFGAWRQARRELIGKRSAAGLPLAAAGEEAPASSKSDLFFERS